jgi:transposase
VIEKEARSLKQRLLKWDKADKNLDRHGRGREEQREVKWILSPYIEVATPTEGGD